MRSLADYFALMYPQLQGIDLRRDASRLEIPVYLVQGRYRARSAYCAVPAWLNRRPGPAQPPLLFERAGHSTAFEEFRRFYQIMTSTVLPETYPGAPGGANEGS